MTSIQINGLTKRFGTVAAVDDLSFEVAEGNITGFLGPNGAGKTTTLRMLLGLVEPTAGSSTIAGKPYRELADPFRQVGAVLESTSFHPGRRARDHLRVLCTAAGLAGTRVDEVLDEVGLADVGDRRVKGFSLGMRQRLGLAAALLGEPEVLILDEPANGLDPEGILWIRNLLKGLAAEGRTVFLSSHLMAEMAQTAEHLVVIGRGRLIADTTVAEIVAQASQNAAVIVRTPQAGELRDVLVGDGVTVKSAEREVLEVHGLTSAEVGAAAAAHQIVLHELIPQNASLEEAFMRLTGGAVEYHAGALDPQLVDSIPEAA